MDTRKLKVRRTYHADRGELLTLNIGPREYHIVEANDARDDAEAWMKEIARRWNEYPALLTALKDLVETIEFQAEANFLNEDADEGEDNSLTRARAAIKAAEQK